MHANSDGWAFSSDVLGGCGETRSRLRTSTLLLLFYAAESLIKLGSRVVQRKVAMRAELNTFRACCLLASVLVFAGATFAQSKSPLIESRPPAMNQVAPAGNYHFHVHLGTYCCSTKGISSNANNASDENDITAPYGIIYAQGDANWQPSKFLHFSKAVATGQRTLQQTPAPAPSLGDVAREQRDSKTSNEKADVVIRQDAKGKPVVVEKQP
jgi:hypothetical protein